MGNELPERIAIRRRVHQGALTMVLRNADNVREHRQAILDDIANHLSTREGISVTGGQIDKQFTYDPNTKELQTFGENRQRYLLEVSEWIVLEAANKSQESAGALLETVFEEIANRINQDLSLSLTGEVLMRDFELEPSPKGGTRQALIRKVEVAK